MFEFNGRRADDPDLGIYRVLRVLFPLLPGTEDRFLEMPGMDGAYDFGRDLQPREIGVQFVLKQDSPENLFKYARKIAAWLNVAKRRALFTTTNRTNTTWPGRKASSTLTA